MKDRQVTVQGATLMGEPNASYLLLQTVEGSEGRGGEG